MVFALTFLGSLPPCAWAQDSQSNYFVDATASRSKVWLACNYKKAIGALGAKQTCDISTWHGRAIIEGIGQCQAAVRQPHCQKKIKQDPLLEAGLKKCDEPSICDESNLLSLDFRSCRDGFILGTGEMMQGLGEGFSEWAKSVKESSEKRNAFLVSCKSIECKRTLIRDIPKTLGIDRFPQLERLLDENGSRYSAVYLEAERTRLIAQYLQSQRLSMRSRSMYDLAMEAERQNEWRENHKYKEAEVFSAAYEMLTEKSKELNCFDAKTQATLICWGAAYIVDPLMVAGAAAKGANLAKFVVSHVAEHGGPFRVLKSPRTFDTRTVPLTQTVGARVETVRIQGLPETMSVGKYKNSFGEEFLALERTVQLPDGKTKKLVRELPIDPMTGTFDANFPTGRDFLENMIHDLNGKVALAVIDIDNLGFVSKNFTHGFNGTPAEVRAKSMSIGDQYIKSVATALKQVVGDRAQIWRTGGDEFALVIHETDPKKVKAILDQVAKRMRERDVREVFTAESRTRAKAYAVPDDPAAASEMAQAYRLGYAPYSQPNVSLGSVIVNNEDIGSAFQLAEAQAKANKITTKESFAADTTKYGGRAPDADAIPRLTFVAQASVPAQGTETAVQAAVRGSLDRPTTLPPVQSVRKVVSETRSREVFRVGEVSVVEYRNELGQTIVRGETFFAAGDGSRSFAAPELYLNAKTGLLDGRQDRTRQNLETFATSKRTPDRAAIWINAENLGMANNFAAGGMATGDQLLGRTATLLKESADATRLPVKMTGSEFLVLAEDLPQSKLREFTENLQKRLNTDPEIKKIYDEQETFLRLNLTQTSDRKTREIAETALNNFLQARSRIFSVHETSMSGTESLSAVLSRTRGLRYPD